MRSPQLLMTLYAATVLVCSSACMVGGYWRFGASYNYDDYDYGPVFGHGYYRNYRYKHPYLQGFFSNLLHRMMQSHWASQTIHHHHHHYYYEKPGGGYDYKYKQEAPRGDSRQSDRDRGRKTGGFSEFFRNMFHK